MCRTRHGIACCVSFLLVGIAAAAETALPGRAALSGRERAELLQKLQRFESLPARGQRRIRELDRQINRDPKSAALDQVATRYYQWLRQQTAGRRAELRALAPDHRIEMIRRLQAAQRAKEARTLSSADQKAVIAWLRAWMIRKGRGHMLSDWSHHLLAENDHHGASDLPGRRRTGAARIERKEMMARTLMRVRPDRLMHLMETEDIERLAQRLSPTARKTLEQMTPEPQRKRLVVEWIHQAVRAVADRPTLASERWTQERLERFFVQQIGANDLREKLLNLPREEMLHALRRLAAGRGFQRGDRSRRLRPEPDR